MALTKEWRARIDHWRRVLPDLFYRPLGAIEWHGLVTTEQLSPAEALQRDSWPMPAGTRWGAKWEYGWFIGGCTTPPEAERQRLVLIPDLGGESTVYINGSVAGGVAPPNVPVHRQITLAHEATAGQRYEVLIEAYAGHGPRVSSPGPVPLGRESVPEPPLTQAVVGHTTYGIWLEEMYQLWVDVETLYRLRDNIDQESLRVVEIDRGLRDFTLLFDPELPHDELLESARAARERLAPLLACHNGSTAPLLTLFGHSHIDVAWLWPLAETERKCLRTFGTQLALIDEYPDYCFLQSQPHLYWMVQQRDPALYARVQEAAERGQWLVEGGMWVEADTNLSGGESLIRQFLYGKRFYRDEFGVESEMLWLPDVFGYSGSLPQIMRGCGIRYFATAKIFWAYHAFDPFPYNTFTWEGIDGSEILVHLVNDYNSEADPASLIERWRQRVQKDDISTRLVPYGWGDGGGGPTRDHLEYIRRSADLEGMPRTRNAHPLAFFHDLEEQGIPDARYVGELYFQCHRGTLTSQARTKWGNRKSEFALREADFWVSAAHAVAGAQPPTEALHEAWRTVLLNQFHDIIPGSSIQRVYEEAEANYAEVLASARTIVEGATGALSTEEDALTLFNSLNWERPSLVTLPDGWQGAADAQGRALVTQPADEGLAAMVTAPACGWTTIYPNEANPGEAPSVTATPTSATRTSATPTSLENDLLRVTLNAAGELTSIYDKEQGRELLAGVGNRFCMYKDVPSLFDAWDIDSMYRETPVALEGEAEVQVVTEGPLFATVRVTRTLHHSRLTQEITLAQGSRRIEFASEIDWQERHKLLKVAFPVDIHASEALHEIQFGHLARPNHRSRPYDADQFEVANHKWTALAEADRGCAVLNDCKYGVSVEGQEIALTLLKSALAPDMTADLGLQRFTYAFYAWRGPLSESDLVRQGYELNVPLTVAHGATGERNLMQVDAPGIVIETLKPAEDGSGDLILRLYESRRSATSCTLCVDLPVAEAFETNMLEEEPSPLNVDEGAIPLMFRAFEVKTLRLVLA